MKSQFLKILWGHAEEQHGGRSVSSLTSRTTAVWVIIQA